MRSARATRSLALRGMFGELAIEAREAADDAARLTACMALVERCFDYVDSDYVDMQLVADWRQFCATEAA